MVSSIFTASSKSVGARSIRPPPRASARRSPAWSVSAAPNCESSTSSEKIRRAIARAARASPPGPVISRPPLRARNVQAAGPAATVVSVPRPES